MIPEISIGEFLLFTIIALVIIRPEDWPKVLRKVGYYYGKFHDFMLESRQYTRRTYNELVYQSEDSPSDFVGEPLTDDPVGVQETSENTDKNDDPVHVESDDSKGDAKSGE